jgi:dTDP-4-amino-4,6-dideoxygalactose transaminase
MQIPYGRQSINWQDRLRVIKALGKPLLTTGPLVKEFESKIASLSRAQGGAVTVSSGTAALHCAYYASSVRAGDEVITTPLSFIATASTATQLGAKVVFADVQEDTGNLNPLHVETLITNRTKAVTAVDYAGHPADINELLELTNPKGINLIQDAAHSIGSTYRGSPVGFDADFVAFSFFPTKNVTTAEGGALVGKSKSAIEIARNFRANGMIRNPDLFRVSNQGPWHQEVHEFGLNYRLPDVLCALGLSQLNRIQKFKSRRAKIFSTYISGFEGIEGITLPSKRSYVDPMWHLFPIRVDPVRRERIFNFLRQNGVLVQVNYLPIYWHPVYQDLGYKKGECPVAERYYLSEISLPMYSGLRRWEQERIIQLVKEALTK